MANEQLDDDNTEEQLSLIPSSDLPDDLFIDEEGKRGHYTLDRLRKYKPEKYKQIVSFLAEGLSQRATARMCKVARETIAAVADAEQDTIRPLKDIMAGKTRAAANMCLERIVEEMDNIPADKLGILFGILTDKAELLSGNATQRVEHASQETVSDLATVLDRLGHKVKEGEITGSMSEKPKQIGEPGPGSKMPIMDVQAEPVERKEDI